MKHLRISDDISLPLEAVTSTHGLLAMRGAGKSNAAVVLAEAGEIWAEHPSKALDSADLHDMVMEKLKPAQRKVLTVLIDVYPEAITREELADATGYTQSGNFQNLVGSLSTLGIATYPSPGYVAADSVLFL